MTTRFACFLLLPLLATTCSATSLEFYEDADGKVLEYVSRIKRNAPDQVHGYSMALVHAEDPDTGLVHRLTKGDVLAHTSHPSSASRQFVLQLQSGHRVQMALAPHSVVTSGTMIVERFSNDAEVRHVLPQDCFFSGPVEGSAGHASFSLCEGELMGTIQTDRRHYEVLTLPPEIGARRRRSTDLVHALVTWTDLEEARDSARNVSRRERSAKEEKDEEDDALVIPSEEDEEEYARSKRSADGGSAQEATDPNLAVRNRRRTSRPDPVTRNMKDKDVVVEVGGFIDAFYQRRMVEVYGMRDTQWFLRLAVLKMGGVAAVLSSPRLGWKITVRLVQLELWRYHPEWYSSDTEITLADRMGTVCKRTSKLNFDQVTIWTAPGASGKGKVGLSWIAGVCRKNYRCTAVFPNGFKFTTELHEFGHSLGLVHDGKAGCKDKEPTGFMGTMNDYARSCYKKRFDLIFPKKRCLFVETFNEDEDEDVRLLTPGQRLGFNGQCKFQHGADFVYFHTDKQLCGEFYCVANNPRNIGYGTLMSTTPAEGTPCAPGRLCQESLCPDISSTSFTEVLKRNTIVDGGWGKWSPFSVCDSSIPGGAELRISTRRCNNPKPLYGAYCRGSAYRAKLCRSAKIGARVNVGKLAAAICRRHRDRDPAGGESTFYTGVGILAAAQGDIKTCSVRCHRSDRKLPSKTMYVMPHGVICAGPNNPFDDELKGIRRYCVNGQCMAFGCNGQTLGEGGLLLGACGVCGGSGKSCVHGEFRGPLKRNAVRTMVILPVGAKNIFIGHPFNVQPDVYIEMWTKDRKNHQPILSWDKDPAGYKAANLFNPINFAGTHWYSRPAVQSLRAAGPINQPVRILLRKGSNQRFSRALYRYARPPAGRKRVVCRNRGTHLAGGCNCRRGFYGLRCEHRCRLVCKNGAKLDPRRCRCSCNSRQTGKKCACKRPYGGVDCKGCSAVQRCQGGGVFDSRLCRCTCPVNCAGDTCTRPCKDKLPRCKRTKCGRSKAYDQKCVRTCKLCRYDRRKNGGRCVPQ